MLVHAHSPPRALYWRPADRESATSIRDYLINSNVQLGATYDVGKKATSRYEQGYQAAAKYINASREEIGTSHLVHYRPVNQTETPPLLT